MNKHTNNRVKVGLLAALLFLTAQAAQASTWTAPTSAPPNGNVDAPLNASTNAQYKAGALAVGQASNPTAGATLDVNGVTSTNGLANFGTAEMLGFVHIGTTACGSGCAGGAVAMGTPDYQYASAVQGPSLLGNVLASIGGSFNDIFMPSKAYATTTMSGTASLGSSGTTYTTSTGGSDGGTTSGTSGGAASGGTSSTSAAGVGTMTTTTATATSSTGSALTYMLQVDGNTRVNGELDVSGVPVCLQNGTNCPAGAVSVATSSGTANTLPKWGSTSGSLADSRIVDDGTNVSIGSIDLDSDQGGSIELGGTSTSNTPYIDFHYGNGTTQDYNARIINDADGQLSFENSSGSELEILNNPQSVSVRNAVPIYKGCSASDHLLYRDNGSGGGCAMYGYLLPPLYTPASTSLVLNASMSPFGSSGSRLVTLTLVYSLANPFISTTYNSPTDYSYGDSSVGALSGSGSINVFAGETLTCGSTYDVKFEGFPAGGSGVYASPGYYMHSIGSGGMSFTVPSC